MDDAMLAEQDAVFSPFAYMGNDPVNYTDRQGLAREKMQNPEFYYDWDLKMYVSNGRGLSDADGGSMAMEILGGGGNYGWAGDAAQKVFSLLQQGDITGNFLVAAANNNWDLSGGTGSLLAGYAAYAFAAQINGDVTQLFTADGQAVYQVANANMVTTNFFEGDAYEVTQAGFSLNSTQSAYDLADWLDDKAIGPLSQTASLYFAYASKNYDRLQSNVYRAFKFARDNIYSGIRTSYHSRFFSGSKKFAGGASKLLGVAGGAIVAGMAAYEIGTTGSIKVSTLTEVSLTIGVGLLATASLPLALGVGTAWVAFEYFGGDDLIDKHFGPINVLGH